MTFSDKAVVDYIEEHFVPVWESVADVTTATYQLDENRSAQEILSGEIVVYFCRPDGKVVDILPGLQTPESTLEAMKSAKGLMDLTENGQAEKRVRKYHAEAPRDVGHFSQEDLLSVMTGRASTMTSEAIAEVPRDVDHLSQEDLHSVMRARASKMTSDARQRSKAGLRKKIQSLESQIAGLHKRIREIRDSPDSATGDMRNAKNIVAVYGAALADGAYFSIGSTSVVNPVDRHHVRDKIHDLLAVETELRTPGAWKKTIFEDLLHMPLESRRVVYENEG